VTQTPISPLVKALGAPPDRGVVAGVVVVVAAPRRAARDDRDR